MSLRFAIIKVIKTMVGQNEEDVVFEHDEDEVFSEIWNNLILSMAQKKDPIFGENKWTETEILAMVEKAWKKTIEDFKKVTIRIL